MSVVFSLTPARARASLFSHCVCAIRLSAPDVCIRMAFVCMRARSFDLFRRDRGPEVKDRYSSLLTSLGQLNIIMPLRNQ